MCVWGGRSKSKAAPLLRALPPIHSVWLSDTCQSAFFPAMGEEAEREIFIGSTPRRAFSRFLHLLDVLFMAVGINKDALYRLRGELDVGVLPK